MSQDNLIKMDCTECGQRRYSYKNKKLKDRLELKKFCKACNSHEVFKEQK